MEKNSTNKLARLSGLVYLLLVVSGIVNLLYIPSQLFVRGNASKTLENIINSELLFRYGIVSGVVTFLTFMILPLILYKLLHKVNKNHAILMVIFALISVPISFVNLLNKFSVLTLISKAGYLQVMTNIELQTQVMLHLDYYNNGNQVVQIFWGLWLLPFGYLVYKSGFLPKILGIFLMLGCFGYLIEFFAHFLIPTYNNSLIQTLVGIPSPIGEIGICLWLLIMGTNKISFGKNTDNKA
jgi:hypothetical protein